jgi:hypothetical protein
MPDPIKSLFEATKSKKIFLDEADFKSQLSKDPQGVFNAVSDSKLFLDFDDFQNTLGLKKKDGTGLLETTVQPTGEPSATTSPSQLPSVSEPLTKLRGADIKAITPKAQGLGVDPIALSSAVNDFEADDDFIVNKAKEYQTNKAEYDKSKAAYRWRSLLKSSMTAKGLSDADADIQLDYVTKLQQLDIDPNTGENIKANFTTALDRVNKIRQAITDNIPDQDDKAEALRALQVDSYAAIFQGMKDQNVVNNWAATGGGNMFIGAGLDALKLTDPEKAKFLEERINNKYAPEEDKQLYKKELEDLGLSAVAFEIDRNFNRVSQSGAKPSENFINSLSNWKNLVEKTKRSQMNRYGDVSSADIDKILFDVTEGLETPSAKKSIYNVAVGATEWLERGLSGIWDYATKNREERIAADMKRDHSKYMTDEILNYGDVGSSIREVDYIPKITNADTKKKIDDIIANTELSRDKKYESVYPLIKSAYQEGQIEFFPNPNKGNINLTSKNVLHLLSTSGARSLGNIIPTIASGGAIPAPIIAGLDATAMKYDEQFREGENDPAGRAIRSGLTVGILSNIMDEGASLAKAFKGGNVTLATARPTTITAMKKAGEMMAKEQVEELATEAIDGDVVKNWKEVMLSTAIIAPVFAGSTAVIDKRRSSEFYRQLWFEAGTNPMLAKSGLKAMLDDGGINSKQYDEAVKRVDQISNIVANMPKVDMNGNPLSDSQKALYADNLMKQYEAKNLPDTLPSKMVDSIKEVAKKADDENAVILEGAEPVKMPAIQVDKPVIETNTLAEVDRVKSLAPEVEDGATFDLDGKKYEGKGLIIPVLSENTTIEELTPKKIADFIEANKAKLGGSTKAGIYKFPNSNKVSIDLNIVVDPKYRGIGLEFGRNAGQESLFDLGTFENVKTGADGKNPMQFSDEQFSEISKALSEGKMPNVFGGESTIEERLGDEVKGDVDQKVQMAQNALQATGVKINMIDNTADFEAAVAERKGPAGVEGVFLSDTGEILINKELLAKGIADGRVVWHEASHPVINIVRNTNSPLFDKVIAGMKEAAKTDKAVDAVLNWSNDNYGVEGEGVVNDEAVVEMIANISEGTIDITKLPTGFKQSVIDFVNSIAKALGFNPVLSDTDVAAFKNLVTQISDALTTGRDISEVVGAENVKEYLNTVQAPGVVTGGEFKIQARTTDQPAINVYESKDIEKLNQRSIEDVYNNYDGKAVVINSDPTRVGELILPSGKKVFMYGGPAYLSIKDNVASNVGFATTQISKVNTWMKYVKDVFGNNPGVTLVASQAPTSILSNSYALRYVMDGISMLPKSVLKSSDFKNEFFGKDLVLLKDAFGEKAYNEFVNKYKKADLSDPKVIDEMIAEMAYKVGDDNKPASFKARGAFVANLLGGIAPKSALKGVEGDIGYVSKKPNKFISKQLMDRLGINAEKVMREIGEPSLVDLYMNDGKWGFAVAGFETDPNMNVESVQQGGVKHPLFNAKFPGKNAFILDGAYELNKMFTPVEITGPSGKPYTKTAAQMLAGSMYVKGEPLAEGGSFEYVRTTPAGRRIQASRGRRDLDAKLKAFAQKERELGSTDQEIEQAIRNRFPLMDKARIDEIMVPVTVAQPTVGEKLETVVQPEGEEKVRGMEKRLGDLDEDTYNKIVDESKTYFSQPNKQTEKAAEEFMKGKSLEYMAEFVTSNPNIPGAVNVWMAAMTAKKLGTEIDAAKKAGDVDKVEMLSAARANIYNHFSAKATELGQTVQAFVSFKNDPAANQFIFNKILKQLEEKGVTGLTDSQKAEIKKMLDDVSTAAAGLPKDMAITKLSHYLGKLTPISAFDIMQAMWYAKILSGITTQSKNFFANMVNTFVEVPVVAMRMSVQTGSLQPIFYAMKGLGGGAIKGLVKAGDILKSGVTSKAEDKFFNNDNLLEYFTWSDTKIGKGLGGAVGKILDFPLLFETSPRALKFVGRSLTASDALFSTANQEAAANMLAFAQAKQEGLKGNVYNRVQQILNNTKQSVVDAKAQATGEGFKPGTVQHKRRMIELVNQNRGEEIVTKAEEMGKRATLTNEPEGFTRGIYMMATKIQETMPISKVMIPFTRIVANVSEMMINFSPAGTYRAVTGIKNPKFSFKFTPSGDNKLTNDQRADLFIKSMIGITALTVLANNIGDDEDDWFDITAGGPTDFAKKYELMKGGWRPYTITFKDGTKINYAEWPVAGALSALGTVLDVDRYGNVEDPEWIDKMVIGAAGYMSSIYDKSLLKGISDFVDIFRPTGKYGAGSDDFIKRTVENTTKFGAQQAKALTLSNFSQQALKLTDEYKDNPIREAKGAEVFYRDIPIINDGLNPIVDVFGDPVTYATTERLLPWMSVSDEKKDQVLAYLNRNNVFVGMAKEKPMINLDNGEERKMTRQELYEYRKLAGKYTKEFLYENISTLKDINAMENGKEMMKQVVADFTSAARDRAYAEILIK